MSNLNEGGNLNTSYLSMEDMKMLNIWCYDEAKACWYPYYSWLNADNGIVGDDDNEGIVWELDVWNLMDNRI